LNFSNGQKELVSRGKTAVAKRTDRQKAPFAEGGRKGLKLRKITPAIKTNPEAPPAPKLGEKNTWARALGITLKKGTVLQTGMMEQKKDKQSDQQKQKLFCVREQQNVKKSRPWNNRPGGRKEAKGG